MYTYTAIQLEHKTFGELKAIARELNIVPSGDRRCRQSWIDAIAGVQLPLLRLLETPSGVELDRVQEPIAQAAETSPGVELDRVQEPIEVQRQEPIESKFGRIIYPQPAQKLIEPAAESEVKVSQRAIGLAAKNSFDSEADQKPILIGIALSNRFLARYSPPQSENIHYHADADGQLSLFNVDVESIDELPDPDDFDSMFAFWAAYDAWATNDDNEISDDNNEISLDSFCEWAPCPDDWYEPAALLEPSEVLEVTSAIESSSTSKFLIPVFDAWCDRLIDTDEPPDTGIFARLPKPKPPGFPPMAIVAGDRSSIRNFARSATLLSDRAPPGGDAMA